MQEIKSSKDPAFPRRRYQVLSIIAASVFLILIARVYVLQIIHGEEYKAKSESNFIQERRIAHSRGLIFDANLNVLVDNRPSHDLYVTFSFLPDSRRNLNFIADALLIPNHERKELDSQILRRVKEKNQDAGLAVGRSLIVFSENSRFFVLTFFN